ncbi:hypothetical protein [Streptomyces sp. NPDC048734]|uniref:hypothetical protein n=1 Tax=Streptomyces sp. NPDC048734 TaxID=3365590 RepID=UPI00372189E8
MTIVVGPPGSSVKPCDADSDPNRRFRTATVLPVTVLALFAEVNSMGDGIADGSSRQFIQDNAAVNSQERNRRISASPLRVVKVEPTV